VCVCVCVCLCVCVCVRVCKDNGTLNNWHIVCTTSECVADTILIGHPGFSDYPLPVRKISSKEETRGTLQKVGVGW